MQYLEVPTKDTRYVYPTARVRGLEKYLLTDADFTRIKEERSFEDSFQGVSRFYPYSESMKVCSSPEDFEKGLEEEWKRTYGELRSFAPEPDLIDLFWLEQDFHNIKILFKLQRKGENVQDFDEIPYISVAGKVDPEVLAGAIGRDDFYALPEAFKGLIQEAKQMMEREPSGRDIDIFLERKYLSWLVQGLSAYRDNFLIQLGTKLVDSHNIRTLLRVKFWEREDEREILENSLVEGGTVGKQTMLASAGQPVDAVLDILRRSEFHEPVQEALGEWEEKRTLFTLDNSLEEIILRFTSSGFYITFGREPLVNYFFLRNREIRKLRSILRAKKIHLPHEQLDLIF